VTAGVGAVGDDEVLAAAFGAEAHGEYSARILAVVTVRRVLVVRCGAVAVVRDDLPLSTVRSLRVERGLFGSSVVLSADRELWITGLRRAEARSLMAAVRVALAKRSAGRPRDADGDGPR